MSSLKDLLIIIKLLDELCDLSCSKWSRFKDVFDKDISSDAIKNYEIISGIYYPMEKIDKEELIKVLKDSNKIEIEESFYLPPLDYDKDFIPIMNLEADCSKESVDFVMRVGLYRYDLKKSGEFQGFGYRFEKHENSNHSYYHAQLTKSPHNKIKHYEKPKWIAEHLPCLVLPASNPVSLFFSVLISFYGKEIANTFITPQNIDGVYKEPVKYMR